MHQGNPRLIKLTVCGHRFTFELTRLGFLRLSELDGAWNNKANWVRKNCSQVAWDEAWDQARGEVAKRFPVGGVAA
jgi:hypothetical protein